MSKPEWGLKRICHTCGARFYDLHRHPIVCPACNAHFDSEASLKSRRRGGDKAKAARAAPAPEEAKG